MIIDILKTNLTLVNDDKVIKNHVSSDVDKMFKDVILESIYMKVMYNNYMKEDVEVDDIKKTFEKYLGKDKIRKCQYLILDAVYKHKQLMSFVENFNNIHDIKLDLDNMKLVPPRVIIHSSHPSSDNVNNVNIISCEDSTMKDKDGNFEDYIHVKITGYGQSNLFNDSVDKIYKDGIDYMNVFNSNNMEITRACHDHGYYRDYYLQQYPIFIDKLKRDINDFMHSDQL